MPFWIFKANIDKYRIDDRMLDPNPNITWPVTRYQDRIHKGDTVFIWRAGNQRGICAVMQVEACPYEPEHQEIYDGYELPLGTLNPLAPFWAKCTITQRFSLIDASIIKKIPGLELFSFFSAFQQATNFSITRPEGARLLEYIEKRPPEEAAIKPEPIAKPATKAVKTQPVRAAAVKKSKPAAPAVTSPEFALLKCGACGRFVISSDTDRHVLENHAGESVDWKKNR